jgi:hypothetical protein
MEVNGMEKRKTDRSNEALAAAASATRASGP